MIPDCSAGNHPFEYDEEETDYWGNPAPGVYNCMICGLAITMKEHGQWVLAEPEVAEAGRCNKCQKPIDDHHRDSRGNLMCGLEEKPKVPKEE